MRRLGLGLLLLVPALVACGSDRGDPREPGDYGAGVELPEPPATTADAGGPDPASQLASPPTHNSAQQTRRDIVANRTVTDHPSGFRLTFVVGDRLEFSSTDRIRFELIFENTTAEPLYHDSNQELVFVLASVDAGGPRWDSTTCRASIEELDQDKPVTGVLELPPGETSSLIGVYPAEEYAEHSEMGPTPDSCRVPPGDYAATGMLDWCPPEGIARSEYNGEPYCERTTTISARPLRVTIAS